MAVLVLTVVVAEEKIIEETSTVMAMVISSPKCTEITVTTLFLLELSTPYLFHN